MAAKRVKICGCRYDLLVAVGSASSHIRTALFLRRSSLLSVPALHSGPAPLRWLAGLVRCRYHKPEPLALQGCLCLGKSGCALDRCPKRSLRLGSSLGVPRSMGVIHQRNAGKSTWFWPILWLQMRPAVSLAQIRPLQEGRQQPGRFLCLFPFLRTTTLKKTFQTEQPLPLCSLQQQNQPRFLCRAAASLASHLFQAPSRDIIALE